MKPLIIDNFLSEDYFNLIRNIMLGENIAWFYMDRIDYADDVDKFQFIHSFYAKGNWVSAYGNIFGSIFQKLKPKEIYRIKANLLPRTPEIKVNRFHTDIQGNNGVIPYTTSIFYMNANNGYTEFEDGTIVESVANRWISFPEDTKHRGTSCTDEKVRVVINFNYLT